MQYHCISAGLRTPRDARFPYWQGRVGGQRKALIMATHHPPFTAGGHSPSTTVLTELDTACTQAGIMPICFCRGTRTAFSGIRAS